MVTMMRMTMGVVVALVFGACSTDEGDRPGDTDTAGDTDSGTGDTEPPQPVPVTITGETLQSGIFDPSLEYAPTGVGWMAYSWVHYPRYVETHLATSTDGGGTWEFVQRLNHSLDFVDDPTHYAWVYETPTLLFDALDPDPDRRWKLFSQQYRTYHPDTGEHVSLYAEGSIVMQTAATPDGDWSAPSCIFGTFPSCVVDLSSLHDDLTDIVWYNELGSVVLDGVIYVSLDAVSAIGSNAAWCSFPQMITEQPGCIMVLSLIGLTPITSATGDSARPVW